jgi:outer membrane protein TolC
MKQFYLLIFALVMGFSGFSQQEFSLEQAVKYGQSNSPNVQLAQIGVTDADQQIIQNRALGLPTISASANYQHFLQLPAQLVPAEFFGGQSGEFIKLAFGTKNNFTAAVQLQTLIFDASYFTALKASREYRVFASQQVEVAKQGVKKNVTLAYLATLIYDESVTILDSNSKNLERMLFETTELYKEGFAEQLDIDRMTLTLRQLKTQKDDLMRQKQISVNNLKFLMGFPIDQDLAVTDNLENLVTNGFIVEANEKLQLENRAEYQMLNTSANLQEFNIIAQKQQGYYPSLSGFANYQQSLQGDNLINDSQWIPSSIVGLQLSIPIFDGFAREAKIERAKLDLEEVVRQRDQVVESIRLEVVNSRIKYQNAVQKVTNTRENLELTQRIYKTIQIKYKEGLASSFELNQTEGSLFMEQSNYIQALFGLLMAKAELEIALGK